MPYGVCKNHYKKNVYYKGMKFQIVSDKKIWRSRPKTVVCSCGNVIEVNKVDDEKWMIIM